MSITTFSNRKKRKVFRVETVRDNPPAYLLNTEWLALAFNTIGRPLNWDDNYMIQVGTVTGTFPTPLQVSLWAMDGQYMGKVLLNNSNTSGFKSSALFRSGNDLIIVILYSTAGVEPDVYKLANFNSQQFGRLSTLSLTKLTMSPTALGGTASSVCIDPNNPLLYILVSSVGGSFTYDLTTGISTSKAGSPSLSLSPYTDQPTVFDPLTGKIFYLSNTDLCRMDPTTMSLELSTNLPYLNISGVSFIADITENHVVIMNRYGTIVRLNKSDLTIDRMWLSHYTAQFIELSVGAVNTRDHTVFLRPREGYIFILFNYITGEYSSFDLTSARPNALTTAVWNFDGENIFSSNAQQFGAYKLLYKYE